jgi:hypothetical protein
MKSTGRRTQDRIGDETKRGCHLAAPEFKTSDCGVLLFFKNNQSFRFNGLVSDALDVVCACR